MKHIFFTCLFLGLGIALSGQSTKRCWNFEAQCAQPEDAFHSLCIDQAHSASGSPDTKSDYSGVTPFEGTKYARMNARFCPNAPTPAERHHGEGIILKYNFTAGKSYTLKLAHRSPVPPTETKILLVTDMPNFGGLPNGTDVCSDPLDVIPAIPASNQLAGTISPGAGWQVSELVFTPTANFNQIWIRPYLDGTHEQLESINSLLYLDDVCVKETCDPDGFNVSMCRYPGATDLVATINGVQVPQSDWIMLYVWNCHLNTHTHETINWIGPNSFLLPDNGECHTLIYTYNQPGCPKKEVWGSADTNIDNIPECTGVCDDWKIDVSGDPCFLLVFDVNAGANPFPPGTTIEAFLNGQPFSTLSPGEIIYHPRPGAQERIQICFKVSRPDCPAITKCMYYDIDCQHVIGGSDTESRGAVVLRKPELSVTNPATGLIRFSRTVVNGQAQLFTVQGAMVRDVELDYTDRVDVHGLPSGLYLLSIRENAAVSTRLVFVQNDR